MEQRVRTSVCALVAVWLLVLLAQLSNCQAQEARWAELNARIRQLEQEGKYPEALPVAQEATRAAETTFGYSNQQTSTSLDVLGRVYYEAGRYHEAEDTLKRAVTIREKAISAARPNTVTDAALSLHNLASVYAAERKYHEAQSEYLHAMDILERLGKGDSNTLITGAVVLEGLAQVQYEEGNYGLAEASYSAVIEVRKKFPGSDGLDLARVQNKLALTYDDEGKYVEAETLHKQALELQQKALQSGNSSAAIDVAASLHNLALVYFHQHRYREAEIAYGGAIAILDKMTGDRRQAAMGTAYTVDNSATLLFFEGRYAEAERLHKRAATLFELLFGPGSPDLAIALGGQADSYFMEGKNLDAEPLYKRSLAILEHSLGPNHPDVAMEAMALAEAEWSMRHPQEAEAYFERGLEIRRALFNMEFASMSERDRLSYLATVAYEFPTYFSFVSSNKERYPEWLGKMYDVLLWQKGMVVAGVASQRAKLRATSDRQTVALFDQWASKRSRYAALVAARPANYGQWQPTLAQLRQQADDLEEQLTLRSAAFAESKRLAQPSWREVQKALGKGEAAVEFIRFPFNDGGKWSGKTYYAALVVTPQSAQPALILLGDARNLEKAPLDEYRQMVKRVSSEGGLVPGKQQAAVAAALFYDAYWKPLLPALGAAHRVYVAPDGELNQVALGVVPDEEGRLLMDRYDLRIVNSTKDLLRSQQPANTHTAVLFGNPSFGLSEAQQRAALAKLAAGEKRPLLAAATAITGPGLSRDVTWGQRLGALTGTQEEVREVTELLQRQGWQVEVYEGDEALEEVVKRVRSPRVLHLATHGFFLKDQEWKLQQRELLDSEGPPAGVEDPMLRSGLYLAGAERARAHQSPAADLDDGVLTAYEAAELNLQGTELVVLSACDAGLGVQENGEGVFGLRRALEEAGAQAVLMSMWSVPDQETQELMTLFYSNWLKGMNMHEALRWAQMKEREVVRRRYKGDLPYYWGAFVLVAR